MRVGTFAVLFVDIRNFDFSQPGATGSIIIGNAATNDGAMGSIVLTKVF